MDKSGESYRELLEKEERRRKIRITRHSLGITLAVILILLILFLREIDTRSLIFLVGAMIYINYVLYKLISEVKTLYSLDDELHYEDGEIIKYNARSKKTKKWIPIEDVEKVYLNVEDKPNLLFVVYNEDGTKKADSFYKQRIKERDKFMADLEKRSLIVDKPITFEQLKEKVEGS